MTTNPFPSEVSSHRPPKVHRLSGAELAEHLRRKKRDKAAAKARRSRRRGR